ncbi:MAG TPA: glycosyltransferase [Bacteroidia bacterium]|nr:glycosyltransferase [Bacteroidia bacterium]
MPLFDLEIVQPVFNPRDNWADKYIIRYRELQTIFSDINFRIVFVNDGSAKNFEDATIQTLKEKIKDSIIVSYTENKGKGFAVRAGVAETTAPFVLYTDYDFPYEMSCLRNAYNKLKENSDIVVGIRNEAYYTHLALKRKLVSKACNFLNKVFLKIPHTDTQSGLKGFSEKGKALMLKTTINQFLFDTEFVCMAYQNKNVKVSTIDVELRPGVKFTRMSTKTILRETINFASILIRSSFGKLKS